MFTNVCTTSALRVEEVAKEASGHAEKQRTLPAARMLHLMFAPEVETVPPSEIISL
jgi:hypothetical protein